MARDKFLNHHIVSAALSVASSLGHDALNPEHLLQAVMDEPELKNFLEAFGTSPQAIQIKIAKELSSTPRSDSSTVGREIPLSATSKRLLNAAALTCASAPEKSFAVSLLVELIGVNSEAGYLLRASNLTQSGVLAKIEASASGLNQASGGALDDQAHTAQHEPPLPESDLPTLDSTEHPNCPEELRHQGDAGLSEADDEGSNHDIKDWTTDLTAKAARGEIEPVIGREAQINHVIEILCHRGKNNPILLGDEGVGKSAVVEGLALAISKGQVPTRLRDVTILSLDVPSMLAGTKFRGDFEARLKLTLTKVENSAGRILIFIDEVHTIVGAGSVGSGSIDAANIMKPALARGRLSCIAATTYAEYRRYFRKDKALARRFQTVKVPEPSHDETVTILMGVRSKYETFHKVRIPVETVGYAVEMAAYHLPHRRFPDKALDLLDDAATILCLAREKDDRGVFDEATPVLSQENIDAALVKYAGVPPSSIGESEASFLNELEATLSANVIDQNEAVRTVVSAMRRARAGVSDPNRPIASYLFRGPTGVGKTEIALTLARVMGLTIKRFDMAEFGERHTVSRLIGAPPGYVGYEDGGALTDYVDQNPHSLLLLDEIEKAHPDLFNILLGIMDHGRLTDGQGNSVDFRHTVLIMTSNVGEESAAKPVIGFGSSLGGDAERSEEEMKNLFAPEFINRLDAAVRFQPLQRTSIGEIAEKNLFQLAERMKKRKLTLTWTPAVIDRLAVLGFSSKYGARPMARKVQAEIGNSLADLVIAGGSNVRNVTIDVKDDRFVFTEPPTLTVH